LLEDSFDLASTQLIISPPSTRLSELHLGRDLLAAA
jgi:hypothetical protein